MLHKSLGFGLGLRVSHYQTIIDQQPDIDWFEILTENYLVAGGNALYYLDRIREHYPIVMHGVSLSIGSADPINYDYLAKVKSLSQRTQAAWISDHLCWTGVDGVNLHDLIPLPYTEEALQHVVERVKQVQEFLGRRILLENVSSYLTYTHSTIPEWEFVTEIANRADCLLLLDVNNVYVSAFNHQFDASCYLDALPIERVQQFHLAGHTQRDGVIIDTHDNAIIEPVWQLYQYAVRRFPTASTLIERDDNIPALAVLQEELALAKRYAQAAKVREISL